MSKNGIFIAVGVFVLAVVGLLVYLSEKPSHLDGLAQCIKDSGATFYGAFWCPHCQATKKMFGTSASLLPYVECSTPDQKDQTQICKDKKIESYPTWEFKDGNRETGELTLEELSQKTNCPLP